MKHRNILFVGFILLSFLLLLNGVGYTSGLRGFGRITVLYETVKYSGNQFEFTIMNDAGQEIEDIHITAEGSGCGPLKGVPKTLPSKGKAHLRTTCDYKEKDERFSVDIDIMYNKTVAGSKVPQTEGGTIRGSVGYLGGSPPKPVSERVIEILGELSRDYGYHLLLLFFALLLAIILIGHKLKSLGKKDFKKLLGILIMASSIVVILNFLSSDTPNFEVITITLLLKLLTMIILALFIFTRLLKFERKKFRTHFFVGVINSIINPIVVISLLILFPSLNKLFINPIYLCIVFIIGVTIPIYTIKKVYHVEWSKSLLMFVILLLTTFIFLLSEYYPFWYSPPGIS